MSVVSCIETDLEGKREFQRNLESGETGKRTFIVTMSNETDTEVEVLTATQLPPVGTSLWPGSLIALCYQQTPSRVWRDQKKWQVVCEYKSQFNQKELEKITNPNPLNRATVVSGQFRTILMPVRRMLSGDYYQTWNEEVIEASMAMHMAANSAGDPLDPPVEQAFTEAELRFRKNVTTLPAWFTDINLGYHNGVNSADQIIKILNVEYTLKKATAKLCNFTFGEPQKENGITFLQLSWGLNVKKPREIVAGETVAPGPWDVERLDEGMRKRDTSGGETIWKNIRDRSDQSLMLPVPFDGEGDEITAAGTAIPEGELWWSLYRPCGPRVDYAILPWT